MGESRKPRLLLPYCTGNTISGLTQRMLSAAGVAGSARGSRGAGVPTLIGVLLPPPPKLTGVPKIVGVPTLLLPRRTMKEDEGEEEEEEEEEERERAKEKREAKSRNILSKDRRLTAKELGFLIDVLELDTSNGSKDIRAAISELLEKLKEELGKPIVAAPAVSEEEDAVADLSDPLNEGRLLCITEENGESRVALLVSARSTTNNLEVKQVKDWRGPMQDAYLMKSINGEWSSEKEGKEALWLAGGARDPHKPLLRDLFLEAVEYNNTDKWRLVQTRYDLDYFNATVTGRTAAELCCSDVGNSKVSFKYTLDGVDGKVLRATVGDNVALCMTPELAAAFQTFCWNRGRLLPRCKSDGDPVKFFGATRKSITHGVLRAFLESSENLFVRVVGYGTNIELNLRGLTVLKKLRDGVGECKQWKWPRRGDDAWSSARITSWKDAMWKQMSMDFSGVTPMDGVGKGGGEARVVRLKRKRTRKGKKGWGVDMSKLKVDVYPVNGKTCGTLKFRNVRSRSALFGSSHCGSVVFWS